MKILLIDDDQVLCEDLKLLLESKGYIVNHVSSGKDGISQASISNYDLILLDWMLPDISGDEVCQTIRKNKIPTPIIFLTAKNQLDDKVKGLDIGADDYMTKPFQIDELLARVRSILRRSYSNALASEITAGNLTLDTAKCQVKINDKELELSPKLYNLLEYLCYNKDKVVSRSEIIEHIWDENADLFSNVIDVHIRNLRQSLEQAGASNLIKTIKGKGYMLCSEN